MYNFGETVSIVFWTDTWRPESFYDKIKKNRNMGLHTLCLLGKNFTQTLNECLNTQSYDYIEVSREV